LPYTIKRVIYTNDKTIIALAGVSDIYIFDEIAETSDNRSKLREVNEMN
jgi:hypothetical protein